jgi:hypothetical protein
MRTRRRRLFCCASSERFAVDAVTVIQMFPLCVCLDTPLRSCPMPRSGGSPADRAVVAMPASQTCSRPAMSAAC